MKETGYNLKEGVGYETVYAQRMKLSTGKREHLCTPPIKERYPMSLRVRSGLTVSTWTAILPVMTSPRRSLRRKQAGCGCARAKLLKNGEEIATFLSAANPNWPKEALLSALAAHAGHHMAQIEAINAKNWPSGAQTWEAMKNHIYTIADVLASGIVKQFPAKF